MKVCLVSEGELWANKLTEAAFEETTGLGGGDRWWGVLPDS